MVKTQSSNFDAEWRNGNDSEMRCESLAGASPGVDGSLLRRPCSVAWVMADIFLIPAFLWLYKHLKKEQVR